MQPHGAGQQKLSLPGVKSILAVASGKGGVGKSTIADNLALALQKHGHRVGLLDADIYGPSVPRMMGVPGVVDQSTTRFPIERYGVKLMSMGFLVPPTQAVVWRGPMVHKAITDFLANPNIAWGELDYLLVDLPPGTGDAQLTLSQSVALTAAIIVTMPQDASLTVARRGLEMFRQVRVPVLGVVENMSYFVGDDGKRYEIFRHGGGNKLAADSGVPFLGEIPIDPRIAECGDLGDPIVHKYPESPVGKAYQILAATVKNQLEKISKPAELPSLEM
jgi:ATP-binding protein involved in chromosome partitioning